MCELDTPAARWRESGEADPHGDRFDCQRKDLPMGDLTDDEMANEVFMRPMIGTTQAAKDRIRWLSRRAVSLETTNKQLLEALIEAEFIISVELGGVITSRINEAITNAKQVTKNQ